LLKIFSEAVDFAMPIFSHTSVRHTTAKVVNQPKQTKKVNTVKKLQWMLTIVSAAKQSSRD